MRARCSTFQPYAGGAPLFDDDLADRLSGFNLDPQRLDGAGHGLGNGTHAADGVTPDAFLAVDLAKGVMHQNVG